jgi:hypothetical protein
MVQTMCRNDQIVTGAGDFAMQDKIGLQRMNRDTEGQGERVF